MNMATLGQRSTTGAFFFLISSILAFSLLLPLSAPAQDEILRWIGGEIGKARPSLNYQFLGYSTEEVASQGKDFKLNEHRLFTLLPFLQSPERDASVYLNLRAQDVETSAILPDTRESFPDELWNLRLGGQYRQRFENGWIGGAALGFGSASDKPFASWDEIFLDLNLFVRIPHGGRNAWLFFLNYSKTREFLPHVPLPGVGYWYEPNDQARLVVGIPFAFLTLRPVKEVSLSLSYFIVRSVRARVTYSPLKSLHLYGNFEWRNESYYRAERQDDKDRLFYYEKQISAGIQVSPGRHVSIDLSAGYAFDRFYFEGRDYEDRDRNRVSIGSGPFLALRAGVNF
jgi:hypothetical protein